MRSGIVYVSLNTTRGIKPHHNTIAENGKTDSPAPGKHFFLDVLLPFEEGMDDGPPGSR